MASFTQLHLAPYPALTEFIAKRPLAGKSILVTGASRGVGAHIARELAGASASRIALIGRSEPSLSSSQKEFAAAFPDTEFTAFAVDVMDAKAVANVFDRWGVPDVLINNAGVFPDEGSFISQDLKKWFNGFEVNVYGTAVVTQEYLKAREAAAVSEKGDSVVLNVSSIAAYMRLPLLGWSGYNSSKTAQARIFETLRFEHPDVRFTSIHPGAVESDGFARSGAGAQIPSDQMTDGKLAGMFYAWAATDEAKFLSGRFAWANWDVDALKAREVEILDEDLLLLTIDGFVKGH